MRFSCDDCNAQYMISDEKVGPAGVKVRCKKCGHIIAVKRAPAVVPTMEGALVEGAAPAEAGTATLTPAPAAGAAAAGELDAELGAAFQNVFGGGSAAIAAERAASRVGGEPDGAAHPSLAAANAAQNPVATAESYSD